MFYTLEQERLLEGSLRLIHQGEDHRGHEGHPTDPDDDTHDMDDEQDCKEHHFPQGSKKIESRNIVNTLFHKALRISRCFERAAAVEDSVGIVTGSKMSAVFAQASKSSRQFSRRTACLGAFHRPYWHRQTQTRNRRWSWADAG